MHTRSSRRLIQRLVLLASVALLLAALPGHLAAAPALSVPRQPALVKDINTTTGPVVSNPSSVVELDGVLYFVGSSFAYGAELWASDGTPEGTTLVKDINPNSNGSDLISLTVVGLRLYFVADDGIHGHELWTSDGTPEGTILLKDINPGTSSMGAYCSDISGFCPGLTVVGTRLYFVADDGVHGPELWISDGTPEGTILLKDITPAGYISSSPYPYTYPTSLTVVGMRLYFIADDGVHGHELWTSDGTPAGTTLLKDIIPARDPISSNLWFPLDLTPVGTRLYFIADDGVHGPELWFSDGTPESTIMLKDINPGSAGAYQVWTAPSGIYAKWFPLYIRAVNGQFYFTADDGIHGVELWMSDGTPEGTSLLKDINPGGDGAFGSGYKGAIQYWSMVVGERLYFIADDGVRGYGLWSSDGTPDGTLFLQDIYPGNDEDPYSYEWWWYPCSAAVIGRRIYLITYDRAQGHGLWTSDGTPAGTILLIDPHDWSPSGDLIVVGTRLYFVSDDSVYGRELWTSDGTPAGTTLLKDTNPGSDGSAVAPLAVIGTQLFFYADDGVHGPELWSSDGTSAGTLPVTRRADGTSSGIGSTEHVQLGARVYFSADDGIHGTELWSSDGTSAATTLVKDINPGSLRSSPRFLTRLGARLYFVADDGVHGLELWTSDGTVNGTVLLKDINPGSGGLSLASPIVASELLYFVVNDSPGLRELWMSDGTAAGTVLVQDSLMWVNPPGIPMMVRKRFYIAADDGVHGEELWTSDGTAVGTTMLKDINPGDEGSGPTSLTVVGTRLYFVANDGVHGAALWVSDGTSEGTTLLKEGGDPSFLVALGSQLYFIADKYTTGWQLWTSDGTPTGTTMLSDIAPGDTSSFLIFLTAAGGRLYLAVEHPSDRPDSRPQLWTSDGTATGTRFLTDLVFDGYGRTHFSILTAVDRRIYFSTDDGVHGEELWTSDGTAAGTTLVADILPGSGGANPQPLGLAHDQLLFAATDAFHGREIWSLPVELPTVYLPVIRR